MQTRIILLCLIMYQTLPIMCQRGTFWGSMFDFLTGKPGYTIRSTKDTYTLSDEKPCETLLCAVLPIILFLFILCAVARWFYISARQDEMTKQILHQQCQFNRLKLFDYVNPESFNQATIDNINRTIDAIKSKYNIISDDVSRIKDKMIIDVIIKNRSREECDLSDINNWTFDKLDYFINQ